MECPVCKASNTYGIKYCIKCGRNLEFPQEEDYIKVDVNDYISEDEFDFTEKSETNLLNQFDFNEQFKSDSLEEFDFGEKDSSDEFDFNESFETDSYNEYNSFEQSEKSVTDEFDFGEQFETDLFNEFDFCGQTETNQDNVNEFNGNFNISYPNKIEIGEQFEDSSTNDVDFSLKTETDTESEFNFAEPVEPNEPINNCEPLASQPYTEYTDNSMPLTAQPYNNSPYNPNIYGQSAYSSPQLMGYNSQGLPVYSQPQFIGRYTQNNYNVYTQPQVCENTYENKSVPIISENIADSVQNENSQIDEVAEKFIDFLGENESNESLKDDFFGKSSNMRKVNMSVSDNGPLKKRKKTVYMTDVEIMDAENLSPNVLNNLNQKYMKQADAYNSNDLGDKKKFSRKVSMGKTQNVDADMLAPKINRKSRIKMGDAGQANADDLEAHKPVRKKFIMAEADHAVEALPKKKKYADEFDLTDFKNSYKKTNNDKEDFPSMSNL